VGSALELWVTDHPHTPGHNWRVLSRHGYVRDFSMRPYWLGKDNDYEPGDGNIKAIAHLKLAGGPDCLAEYVEAEGRFVMRGNK